MDKESNVIYKELTVFKNLKSGKLYSTQELAEKDGLICDKCKGIKEVRTNFYCDKCNKIDKEEKEKAIINRYNNRQFKEWDKNVVLVYDQNTDEWFQDPSHIEDHYEDERIPLEDARLIIGEPTYLDQLEEEHWLDEVHEEFEFSKEFKEALNNLNEICKKTIGCYMPGRFRTKI